MTHPMAETAIPRHRHRHRHGERGNALFIVMITVVLFAALMFTFSRGARQGGDNLSEKRAAVAASGIIAYAQQIERAVQRVYGRSVPESTLSFQNPIFAGLTNAACTSGSCMVFASSGGAQGYKKPDSDWSISQTNWIFTGGNAVLGVGRDCADASCSELLMMLEDLPLTLCMTINEQLGVTASGATPPEDANVSTVLFTGTFNYAATDDIGDENTTLRGKRSACLRETATGRYFFYHTLLER